MISYDKSDDKGYTLTYTGGRRGVVAKDGGRTWICVVVSRKVEKNREVLSEVIMAALEQEASGSDEVSMEVQKERRRTFTCSWGT
ncbi:hypothetical protein PC116_g1922 [Phytophthora cactorum]|uniref:Uncharacterized protein n=1 Tax=Phytophthora cactorum TaxID=29920 RepID=A0A8T1LLH8_9STRA|nr:hypothetical protein PC114_g21806 [Phytophthora cactorum]KAG2902138.1 hypothetical protein PC117_g21546 [Phytophthora cactorum]KAG2981440.1 hypothetical protein PC119_g21024 [Phytophthora cactorum]KAG2999935.1 hypothetical protein PC120_g20808 [Phytophthora cactorum]KAG3135389.1 hypothetical protein C6341_g21787 [Phytophthora cactorum]